MLIDVNGLLLQIKRCSRGIFAARSLVIQLSEQSTKVTSGSFGKTEMKLFLHCNVVNDGRQTGSSVSRQSLQISVTKVGISGNQVIGLLDTFKKVMFK